MKPMPEPITDALNEVMNVANIVAVLLNTKRKRLVDLVGDEGGTIILRPMLVELLEHVDWFLDGFIAGVPPSCRRTTEDFKNSVIEQDLMDLDSRRTAAHLALEHWDFADEDDPATTVLRIATKGLIDQLVELHKRAEEVPCAAGPSKNGCLKRGTLEYVHPVTGLGEQGAVASS